MFGERLGSVPATALSHALGETLGASGMLQTIAFMETAREGRLPGVSGIADAQLDDSLPKLNINDQALDGTFNTGLVVSLGYDGSSAASIISVPSS